MRFKALFALLFTGFFLNNISLKAQKPDSLLKELGLNTPDAGYRLQQFLNLAYKYEDINPDDGLVFADKAIVLAQDLNGYDGLAKAYLMKGENLFLKKDYNGALDYIQKAMNIYTREGNKAGIATSLNDLGRAYCYGSNYNNAFDYFQQALSLDSQLLNKKQIARVFANLGFYYKELFDYHKSIEFFQKALSVYKELHIDIEQAKVLLSIGTSYFKSSEFSKALEYFQESLNLNKQIDYKPGLALSYYSLGVFYNYIYVYRAIDYFQNAAAIFEEIDAEYYLANTLNAIGSAYTGMADSGRVTAYHQKSFEYYTKALHINEQLNNKPGIAVNLGDLAFDYICSSDYTNAVKCLDKALSINQENNDKFWIGDNLETLALIYYTAPDNVLIKLGFSPATKFDSAAEKMKSAFMLFKETGNTVRQTWELLRINDVYTKAGRYDSAYKYYKRYIELRDSTFNVEKQKGILATELKYDFSKKEDSLKFQQQLTDEKLKQQQQQLELTNKEKDIQKLAYLKTQADLQNEQLEKQKDDKQLTIAQKEKELQQTQVKNLSQQQALAKLHLQQQWFISIVILLLLAAVAFGFIYNNRLKEGRLKTELAKEKAEQEKKDAEFQRSLADVSLTALRSQMNPHFIFNCLNSIKLYTTQNDTVAAVEYLSKFSKLIRLVMENSRNDRIPLSSELQALRLYIEMEVMRFKEKLQYNISVADDVETEYIEIPPLLLQPYVENAIWHGLMQKEEGGRIDVDVSMQKEYSLLEINITDNGIGRAKSAEMKSKTSTKHKSYGMKVTSERIALINQIYKTGANVSIHDLTDANGNAAGTKVTIQIPV